MQMTSIYGRGCDDSCSCRLATLQVIIINRTPTGQTFRIRSDDANLCNNRYGLKTTQKE
jgi:hypothetical protein